MKKLIERIRGQKGATLIEYSLLVVFISITVVAILTLIKPQLENIWNQVLTAITV